MIIRKVERWCEAAERALASTLDDSRDAIVEDVNSGRAELFEVDGGKAWVVTVASLDDASLCICCIAGEGLIELSTLLVNLAGATGLKKVRFFTRRPALKRLLRHLPIKLDGYVFTCDVPSHAQRKPLAADAAVQQRSH